MAGVFSPATLDEFTSHSTKMREAARARRAAVRLRACVDDHEDGAAVSVWDTLGVWQQNDKYQGDVNLRTLRALLSIIDGARPTTRPAAGPPLSWCVRVRRPWV